MRTVYINHASKKELTAIPDVGPATAEKIILERSIKPFRDLFDLAERIDRLDGWDLLMRASDNIGFGSPETPGNTEKKVSIDVNLADMDQLLLIPNVGSVTAEQIIRERKKRPFTDASDLADRIERLKLFEVTKLELDYWEPGGNVFVLEVNQANEAELMIRLDVDQFIAEKIVEARNLRPFADLSDIADRVEGLNYGQLVNLDVTIRY